MIAYLKGKFGPHETPFALEMDGWDKFYREYKGQHPVKYFVWKLIPEKWGRGCQIVKNAHWNLHHRFDPRHRYNIVRTGLKPGYYDSDTRMIHACFQLLVDFVEKECAGESIDWEWNESHSAAWKEIQSLYNWWKNERPTRDEKDPYVAGNDESVRASIAFDDANEKEDQENLHRLINVRRMMWT